jgi:hypothetical protein
MAQQAVRPLTSLRVTTGSDTVVGRLIDGDSTTLRLETASGTRIELQRADVRTLERRGSRARRVAVGGAIGGGIAGAGFAILMIGGLCEKAAGCGDDYPAGILYGGGVGAAAAGLAGAVIGTLITRWIPIDAGARVAGINPATRCVARPRFEAQLPTVGFETAGHFSIAAVCSPRLIVGAETGRLRTRGFDSTTRIVDQDYGEIERQSGSRRSVRFSGAFVEVPVDAGAFQTAIVGSVGLYLTESARFSYYSPIAYTTLPYAGFLARYPVTSENEVERPINAAFGVKVSRALGPNLGIGFATRLHRVGTGRQQFESGITASFRP